MTMFLGYNTNGLAHHDPLDAINLLADLGYRGVALTLDHGVLHPFRADFAREAGKFREVLEQHGMRSVIETGARFLLNPRLKHEPTLLTEAPEQRARRVDFLCRAVDAAALLGSDAVSFWAGVPRTPATTDELWARLISGVRQVIDYAERREVTLAFEPEPGMFIDTMTKYHELLERIDAPCFRLTLDVGHLHCQGELPIGDVIRRWRSKLANVHLEDMRAGVHEHLMFGEGEMDFPPIVDALREVGYEGGLYVELSRHSQEGPAAAERAFEFLTRLPSWPIS